MRKRTDSPGLGVLGSGALTAASTVFVTGFAGVVGIVIAREFGRTPQTDGFFAAYSVFIVIVLAAQAIRVAVLPALARARKDHRLASDTAGYAIAIAVVALPLVLLAEFGADQLADLLTGNGSESSQQAASEALRWMVPAAVAHLFAGLAASALAALDDYVTAALGYAAGSAAGLGLILVRVEPDGIEAVAWGMALNGLIALVVPTIGLAWRARRTKMPAGAVHPAGAPLSTRLGTFAAAASLPIALQLLYVVCVPFAGRLGTGAVTSFGYAYLGAAALVAITASSLGLVSSVPLTRIGIDEDRTAVHIVSACWLALAFVGVAAGVFAVAGSDLVEAVLGGSYGGDVGSELGILVVAFSPWMVATVGTSVTFPLTFVAERTRLLPWIGIGALALQIPLAWVAWRTFELVGLALALAATTFLVLALLLRELGALRPVTWGLGSATVTLGVITALAFLAPALVFDDVAGALVGFVVYVVLLAVVKPRGLHLAWQYMRSLG